MAQPIAEPAEQAAPVRSRFAMRLFYVFAALAVLSLGISVVGKWIGGSIASVGHTDDTRIVEAVVGNNVLAVPANYIRFEAQRQDGEARRLDLYLHWPDLAGYSNAVRDDFNNREGSRRILFLSLEPSIMSRDMSERFDPIYRRLIDLPGEPMQFGLRAYRFSEASGYMNEVLVVGDRPGQAPFVARCLAGPIAEDSLAPCERDVHIGDALGLIYRFPSNILSEWQTLDSAVVGKVEEFLRTGP